MTRKHAKPLPDVRALLEPAGSPGEEVFTDLLFGRAFRIEHIVSHGARSPSDFWYDQDQDEWVTLMRGHACLEFEAGRVELAAGDALLIPARLRHRVASTSADAVWLAVHFEREHSA
ncbi:MAG: cupin domain-containing protein [Gammaproteobacteria bacterium]|nr:cupin domain-containing protein [Gammaproteobacteria bacterium]